jgi:DNA/RNA endonuclease YhcR with UshA esterase domain
MLALVLSLLAALAPPPAPALIAPEDAAKHVGKEVVVQGKVMQIVLSVNLTTHINFGGVYPNHAFTATIFKANQALFPDIRDYDGKVVQVRGVVHLYRNKPEIVLTERAQIHLPE